MDSCSHHTYVIYVLLLEAERRYVGRTTMSNLRRRLAQHYRRKGGDTFTGRYRPIPGKEYVVAQRYDEESAAQVEVTTTIKLMEKHGVHLVRGAQWSDCELSDENVKEIASYIDQLKSEDCDDGQKDRAHRTVKRRQRRVHVPESSFVDTDKTSTRISSKPIATKSRAIGQRKMALPESSIVYTIRKETQPGVAKQNTSENRLIGSENRLVGLAVLVLLCMSLVLLRSFEIVERYLPTTGLE